MKRTGTHLIVLLAVLIGMAAAMSGCSSSRSGEKKDQLVIGTGKDPGTLAPAGTNANQATRIKWNVYETLCSLGYDNTIEPLLAVSWTQTDDTHWKFLLRDNVFFHNGDRLTADDVLFSLELAANGPFAGASGKNIDLEHCTADEDELSVTVALREPDSTFLYSIAMYCITSRAAYEADPDGMINHPVGTGPYEFEEYIVGDSVTLSRFEYYWGEPAKLSSVVYRVIPEAAQRAIELETGGVDLIFDMAQTDADRLSSDSHFQIVSFPSVTNECLFYNNWEGSPFSDSRVRLAASHAINAEAVRNVVYRNGIVSSTFFTEAYDLWRDEYRDLEINSYDLDLAESLMAEAGYPDGFDAVLLVESNSTRILLAEVLQNMLEKIGIRISVTVLDGASFFGTFQHPDGGWDLFINGSSTRSTAMSLARNLMGESSNNYESYFEPEMLALIREGIQASDKQRQQEIMDQMVEIFARDMPYYPLHDNVEIMAYRSDLENVRVFSGFSVRPADISFTDPEGARYRQ